MLKKTYSSLLVKFPKETSSQLLEWIRTEEDRIIWSGNTFKKALSINSFTEHLNRTDLDSFAYFTPRNNLLTYGEVITNNSATGSICRIIVNPMERSKGYGQNFCKDLLFWMKKKKKFNMATLNTFADNQKAINCYRKIGFKIVARKPRSRKLGGVWKDMVVMKKAISHRNL